MPQVRGEGELKSAQVDRLNENLLFVVFALRQLGAMRCGSLGRTKASLRQSCSNRGHHDQPVPLARLTE